MKKVFLILILLLISCSKNTVEPIEDFQNLQESQNDYFPLKIGNNWTYDFLYYPRASDWLDHWLEGKVSWTIKEKLDSSKSTIYKIDKITSGIEINYNFNTSQYDTTFITNKQEKTNFIENGEGFIDLGNAFYNIKIKRFHSDSVDYLIFDSFFSYPYHEDSNIEHDDYTGHRIKVQKNIGIIKWEIDNCSNSSADGNLNLIDFKVN